MGKGTKGKGNKAAKSPGSGDPQEGRVVLTHSTHVEGLIPILQKLVQVPGIRTITPAVIGRAKGNVAGLHLRISAPTRGGFKLVARRGKSVQEVFMVTHLSQAEVEAALDQILNPS